jgi:hypothetical protein
MADGLDKLNARIFGDTQIKIRYTPGRGRYIVTERDLKAGEVILITKPYTLVVHDEYEFSVCHYCQKYEKDFSSYTLICEDCQHVAYCSQQCKDSHYAELHRYECPFLVALLAFEEYEPLLRTKARHAINALVKRKLEREVHNGARDATLSDAPTFEDLELLISHRQQLNDATPGVQAIYRSIYQALYEVMPAEYLPFDDEHLIDLLCKMDCNQFGVWSHEDTLLGLSVHPFACFFNHNCLPNCIRHSVGRDFYFTTLYPVPKNSELTITYIGAEEPVKKRRATLSNSYYFECNCFRCCRRKGFHKYLPQAYDAFFDVIQCPNGPGLLRLKDFRVLRTKNAPENNNNNVVQANNYNTMDTTETQGETRVCSTCGYEKHFEAPVPSVSDFCSKWVPPSEDPNNTDYVMTINNKKGNKKNKKSLRKEIKMREKANKDNNKSDEEDDQDSSLKSMFKAKPKDAPQGDDNV